MIIQDSEIQFIKRLLDSLRIDQTLEEVYNTNNILHLSEIINNLINKDDLDNVEIELLSDILDIGNIVYNNTDRDLMPIEDGIYDLLLEKYKRYNPNYRIGAKPLLFRNKESDDSIDFSMKESEMIHPIKFLNDEQTNYIDQMLYSDILYNKKQFTQKDLLYQPIVFRSDSYITKRIRNTSHEHPELVGTLDKCKFVLNSQAKERGVFEDSNVSILERDFFEPLIKDGIINMNDEYTMILELKYDGVSVEADIENGEIQSARTRGDTQDSVASDITPIFGGYIFPNAYGLGIEKFGMKFEAIVTEEGLYELNRQRGQHYINGRTAIIGLLGSSDARNYREFVTLIPLATTLKDENGEPIDRLVEIEFMNRYFCRSELLRFQVITGNYVSILYQIKKFVEEAEFARDFLPFMYDGVVLSFYDPSIRKRLGRKNSVNKYSVAIKFNAIKKNTIFLGYTFEVGQNGVITPMIHYQPIEFLGARHVKSSGHSYERFKNLALKVGDIISVEYTNDVMPYVFAIPELQRNIDNPNPVFPFPTKCPVCETKLVITDSGRSAYCPNLKCEGRAYKRMESTLAKLKVKDFAYESVKLLEVTSLKQIMNLSDEQLSVFGPNDMFNLKEQLHKIMETPEYDYKLIGSLGFSDIAIKKFQIIFKFFTIEELLELFDKSKNRINDVIEKMTKIKGIGEKTVMTIYTELPHFYDDILFILNHFHIIPYKFANHEIRKVVFSGFRDQKLSDKLSELGFDASMNNTLTKDTEMLIIPNNSVKTSKIDKALKYGIKVLTLDEILQKIEEGNF